MHPYIEYPVDQIRLWISEGWTQNEVAEKLARELDPRVTHKLIYKVCKKHGIKCQKSGPRPGEGHKEWRGGRIVSKHGYIKLYCPDHPTCRAVNTRRAAASNGRYYRKSKYVWEHRLVMEKVLGRYLTPQEVVHHINGVRDDNRPENLIVFGCNADHLAYDLKGKCPKWSPEGKARIQAAIDRRKASLAA